MLTVSKHSGRHVLCSLTISKTPINQIQSNINQIQSNKAQTLLVMHLDSYLLCLVAFQFLVVLVLIEL